MKLKRIFDIIFSFLGLILFSWLVFLSWIIASIETRSNGFFMQKRVGKYGKPFNIIKIKTMHNAGSSRKIMIDNLRITKSGRFFRKTKIDELPQLYNVLIGKMSFVGPRPDIFGFADKLKGEDRKILSILPGITSLASLKYKNEEEILSKKNNPDKFNKDVIYPDKVRLNLEYIKERSFVLDLKIILRTLFG